MNIPLPYEQQRTLFLAALDQAKKAGRRACKPEYDRVLAATTETEAAAVLRDNALWATICLIKYLPDGTYGAGEYVLFSVKDGRLHGERRRWHDNHQLHVHSNFHEGKRHGEHRRWNSSGTLTTHLLFDHGRLIKDYLQP